MAPYFTSRPSRPDCSRVLPELLIGAYPTPEDVAWLAATHGIRALLNLQDDFDLAAKRLALPALEAACAAARVAFARAPVADGDPDALVARLPAIAALLDGLVRDHGTTYLHCNAGMNRAPTVAIAWLHRHRGLALEEAVRVVKVARPCLPYVSALEAAFPSLRPRRP